MFFKNFLIVKVTIAAICTLAFAHHSKGQNWRVSFHAVYGLYQMESMEAFQDELYQGAILEMGLPFEIVDKFPGYLGYEFQLGVDWEKIECGGQLSGRSTGGRISYSDYSGKFNIDNELKSFEMTAFFGYKTYESNGITIIMRILVGGAFTGHSITSDLHLKNEQAEIESIRFWAVNCVVAPGLVLRLPITKRIFADLSARYDQHVAGKLRLAQNDKAHLENENREPVKANWSGMRAGVGIGLKFL